MDKAYLELCYQAISNVQALIELRLPKDLIRADLAKTVEELNAIARVAASQ